MLTENLFDTILIKPAKADVDTLCIVSGYATSAMAFHHLQTLKDNHSRIKINLILGMIPDEGIPVSNHRGFQQIMNTDFAGNFQCSYLTNPPAVHSKVYTWCKDNNPIYGFVGSANYSQTAFGLGAPRREIMDSCDAKDAFDYYKQISKESIYCNHSEAENLVQIYHDRYIARRKLIAEKKELLAEQTSFLPEIDELPFVRINLLDNQGELPKRSGLNWGQREGREPNQAYIHLPAEVYRTDFFPPRGIHFTVSTDDKKAFICSRAQDNGKAVHTPHNNSLIGEYFRNRLKLANGALVQKEDLIKYGKTYVDFYKVDEETYFMDFAPGR